MMIWLIAVLVAVAIVEIFFKVLRGDWIKGGVAELLLNFRAFQQAQDEDEKQRLLLRGGFGTLRCSLFFAGFLLLSAFIVFFFPWALSWGASQKSEYFLATTVVGTVWWLLRVFVKPVSPGTKVQVNNYRLLDRWVHWLALQPAVVRNLSFELDRQFALPGPKQHSATVSDQSAPADRAVYVCGLARSGTTMLLNFLDQSDSFRSLTYRNMPFVLAPNLWGLLNRYSSREARPAERAHGDGVLVDYDSPESFEEVFWRTFSSTATRQGDSYGSEAVDNDAVKKFADYRAIVSNPRTDSAKIDGKLKRYLSKNNNNLLRLRSLSADQKSTIFLVYRDPVATARSLHRLHLHFCAETGDGFTQCYMEWLGHHEFGPGHLPFSFARPRMNPALKPSEPDYWLDYWNAVYLHVLNQEDLGFNLVNHDVMCESPRQMLAAIFAVLGEQADTSAMALKVRPPAILQKPPVEFSPELLSAAKATYARLQESKLNVFKSIGEL